MFVSTFNTQSIPFVCLLSVIVGGKWQHQMRLVTRIINELVDAFKTVSA